MFSLDLNICTLGFSTRGVLQVNDTALAERRPPLPLNGLINLFFTPAVDSLLVGIEILMFENEQFVGVTKVFMEFIKCPYLYAVLS